MFNATERWRPADARKSAVLLLCLVAPSIWMLMTIPPLWRDADAYVQLTENPLIATYWGHAPAYCYVAKVPLFLGELRERIQGMPLPGSAQYSRPALTDTGISLLVFSQHLGLAAALFCFIRAVSQFFWVRLALAVGMATNPLLYTFAHCLGSETLGMILIVVLATKGLRLIQGDREPRWIDWYLFAVTLFFCVLSRELNLGLLALLPAAFLLAWIWNRASALRNSRPAHQRAPYLRHAVVAIAIGVACVAVGHSLKQNLARKTKLHPHSRIGFTFLWRLSFLHDLSPEARAAVLRKVAARARSTEARQVIAFLEQMHAEKGDRKPFMERAILLFPNRQWEELDRALNQMAFAFLLPPTVEHLQAIKTDLLHALTMPQDEITSYLVATTAYYFEHKAEMPACAQLVTFRATTPNQISSIPSQHLYFRLWQGVTYSRIFVVWLFAFAAFVLVARRRRINVEAPAAFGIALTAVGFLLCVTACVLHELEPRLALSMWQMLLLSLCLFLGKTFDLLIEREKSAGQLFGPEP